MVVKSLIMQMASERADNAIFEPIFECISIEYFFKYLAPIFTEFNAYKGHHVASS